MVQILALSLGMFLAVGCASNKKQQTDEDQAKASNNKKMNDGKSEEAKAEIKKLKARIDELESKIKQTESLAEARKQFNQDLQDELADLIEAGKLNITTRRGLLVLQIPKKVLFESGKFNLTDEGKKTLESVASALDSLENRRVLVAGHTDNVPVSNKTVDFKNNWELSTKRAHSSLRVLADAGVSQEKLGAAGFSQFDPIASNDSKESRKKNRRIELVMIPNLQKVLKTARAQANADQNN